MFKKKSPLHSPQDDPQEVPRHFQEELFSPPCLPAAHLRVAISVRLLEDPKKPKGRSANPSPAAERFLGAGRKTRRKQNRNSPPFCGSLGADGWMDGWEGGDPPAAALACLLAFLPRPDVAQGSIRWLDGRAQGIAPRAAQEGGFSEICNPPPRSVSPPP